jgi:hypothetical protein
MRDQEVVNLCELDLMSLCSASSKKDQPNCTCMYFIFEEFCDCVKAQIAAKNGLN